MKIKVLTVGQKVSVSGMVGVIRRIMWLAGYHAGTFYSHYVYDVRFPHRCRIRQGRYQAHRLEVVR